MIEALKPIEIDHLGTANGFEASDPDLVLSLPYANDNTALVTRSNGNQNCFRSCRQAGSCRYPPKEVVLAFYSQADIQIYSSILSAIGAEAFDQTDIYVAATPLALILNQQ